MAQLTEAWSKNSENQNSKVFAQEWFLGQGAEGEAYLKFRPRAKHFNVVHKYFYTEIWGRSAYRLAQNVESLRWLRQYKEQGLLGNIEVVQLYGVSEARLAMYLEYIHGDSVLHLTHRRTDQNGGWTNPTFELRKDLGFKEMEVLRRFDQETEKISGLWKERRGYYTEARQIEINGELFTVVLLIKDQRTQRTIIDLNIMNIVYDTANDRLVIVDPH
ncbi:MAG: hypothetical protein M9899_07880 [Bdellovibrionaceae bacterium]|nr:hypothetical protein [Pseudobdellovibrionaceae bacterium]